MQEIREKYKNDKAEQQRQMMKLQQEEGFNPLAGCLPMFLQIPIFIALFHVLRHLSNSVVAAEQLPDGPASVTPAQLHQLSLYGFTPAETASAAQAKLFGAPLAGVVPRRVPTSSSTNWAAISRPPASSSSSCC